MNFTSIISIFFTKLRSLFHKVSYIINTYFFTSAWDAVCRYHKTLHRNVAALQGSCVAGRRRQQNGVLWVHPSAGRKGGNQNAQYRKCQVDKDLIHRPVWPNTFIFIYLFIYFISWISVRTAPNWFLHLFPRIPLTTFRHCPRWREPWLRTCRSLHLEFVSLSLPTVPL